MDEKNEQRLEIIAKATARPPIVHELGGDNYYTCYWISCGESLKKWWRYCPICGTEIDWGDIDVF